MKKNAETQEVFYYSRRKLAFYLLFNLGLLLLAMFFTWTIFPEYGFLYRFALITCFISVLAIIMVILIHYPLAVITPQSIKIDMGVPLDWKDITGINLIKVGGRGFRREIITFDIKDISKYKLRFIQKLIHNSKFSAFSVPLYAMNPGEAEAIVKTIRKYIK